MTTLKQVNKALEALGTNDRLYKGNGYYYFSGGEADGWPSVSVMVYRLNQLSLNSWIQEYKRLQELNSITKGYKWE